MKIKKSKKLKDIFFGSVLLQIIFLLAYSANFLLAQTTTTTDPNFTIVINSPSPSANISGILNMNASGISSDNQLLTGLAFYLDDPSTTNPADYGFTGETNNNTDWNATIDTTTININNGEYNLYAKGFYSDYNFDNTPYISTSIPIIIDNLTILPFIIEFLNTPLSPLSGNQTFYAQTSNEVDYVVFKVIPGIEEAEYTPYSGTLVSGYTNKYQFTWPTTSFPDGTYSIRAIASNGGTITDVYIYNMQVQNTTYQNPICGDGTVDTGEYCDDGNNVGGDGCSYDCIIETTTSSTEPNTTIDPNQTTNPLQITSVNIPTGELSGNQHLWILLNQEATTNFYITGEPNNIYETHNGIYYGLYDGGHKYYFYLNTTEIPNGEYIIKSEATNGIETIFEKRTINIKNIITDSTEPNTTYICGDGTIDAEEYCDDGNTVSGDGCSYDCKIETTNEEEPNTTIDPNQTTNPLQITSINIPTGELSGHIMFYIYLNKYTDKSNVKFYITGGPDNNIFRTYDSFHSGNINDSEQYYLDLSTNELPNGYYNIKITANQLSETDTKISNITVKNDLYTTQEPILNQDPDTTQDILKINLFNIPTEALGGIQRIHIALNKYIPKENIKFYLIGGPNNINENFIVNHFSESEYYTEFNTTKFPNGQYTIKAEIMASTESKTMSKIINIFNGEEIISNSYPDNTFDTSFISECEKKGITDKEECDRYMSIDYECRQNNILNFEDCSNYFKTKYLDPECVQQGITTFEKCNEILYTRTAPIECQDGITSKEECDSLRNMRYFMPQECIAENITDPKVCDDFMMKNFMPRECEEKGITSKEECDNLMRNSYREFNDMTYAVKPAIINDMIFLEERLPIECEEKRITSFDECKKYLISINLPKECQEAGVNSEDECEKIMFEKYAPEECIDEGISDQEECEKFMFKKSAPDDCKEAGILNPRACEKFMFEKYGGMENIPADKYPYECINANAKTLEECETIMTKRYMPKECIIQGFDNEQDCETYLNKKHMPKECQDAGATTRNECDKVMFKKFGPPECKIAGIDDEIECEVFLLNKYAPKVKCENLEDWQCENFIKDRHLGNIVAKQNKFQNIRERQQEITGKSIKVSELENDVINEENSVSILNKDLILKIISAQENLVLNEEDILVQTSPIVIMIDSDGDGLPDDIEKRIGTDPYKTDSDDDGFDDLTEIKNGYNPKGEGSLKSEITGIEKAIIENQTIEHPKTSGEVDESLDINKISNAKDDEGKEASGYVLSGSSKPNSLATIYIYSDLPVVVTVKTDKYGNWKYELKESLVDGEHEAYVVINDNTGKVINKSNPLNFFIKEAKAVSAKNFITPASAAIEIPKESESSLFYYLVAAIGVMGFAIVIFMTFIIRKKKKI
ncbi:MAG: DUF4215 domain-containing protein [Candidatus Pacebacteria bacterium]|nr:DUF4215 domain-containing protein [Candidatus Paceibacterota bacterium]